MKQKVVGAVLITVLFILGGCGKGSNSKIPVSGKSTDMIEAPLINTEGTEIGEVTLTEGKNGVTIRVAAEGLPPGEHGFHIHEKGECIPPKFESAGGHFNPTHKEHGFDNPKGFHLGDLPNIEVAEDGTVDAIVSTANVTLQQGEENSIFDEDGSSLMIHAKADDYKTDPAGNSGDRIACAVIAE
ncbi:superoxide dismutase family protein [Sporosarcina ureilytica]|uniref:Superoxide dismutase [Cu-Zn] n=1 Tax=Sporosarcina ureilytica TaxID=298596 RepID=A0A1D8JD02_9BACL|nr:superoxide dismutase family protein [Sporosarcina ureilytica]AOV06587.1 superoxide dismutase [Sporosarcina ureilytica]